MSSSRSILALAGIEDSSAIIQRAFSDAASMSFDGNYTTRGGFLLANNETRLVASDEVTAGSLVVVAMDQPPEGQAVTADWMSAAPLMLYAARGTPGEQHAIFERIGPVYPEPNPEGFSAPMVMINRVAFFLGPRADSTLHRRAEELITGQTMKRARIEGEDRNGEKGDGGNTAGGKQSDGRHRAPDNDGKPRTTMTKDGLKNLPPWFSTWRLADPGRCDVYGGSNVEQFDARRVLSEVLAKVENLAMLTPTDEWRSAGRVVHIRETVVLTDLGKTAKFLQFTFKRWEAGALSLFDFLSQAERGTYYPPSAKDYVSADFLSVMAKAFDNMTHAMCAFFSPLFEGAFAVIIALLRDPGEMQRLRAYSVRYIWYRLESLLYIVSNEVATKFDSTGALCGAEVWKGQLKERYSATWVIPSGGQGLQEQRCFYSDVDPQIQFATDGRKKGSEEGHHGGGKRSKSPAKQTGGTPPANAPRVAVVTPAAGGGAGTGGNQSNGSGRICARHLMHLLDPSEEICGYKGQCRFKHINIAQTSYDAAKRVIDIVRVDASKKALMLVALEARAPNMLP